MNCEQVNNLISARIDGEMSAQDGPSLDAHLAECETCRQTLAEMERADADLLRSFAPRREAAGELANRLSESLSQHASVPRRQRTGRFSAALWRWSGFAAAAAAGFVAALVLVKTSGFRGTPRDVTIQYAAPSMVARLTLATGAVYNRELDQQSWRKISADEAIGLGCAVRTDRTSKCELQLPDGSCIRLNSETEARFTSDRCVEVSSGRLSFALPRNAPSFRVMTGATSITACGAADDRGTEFDLAAAPGAAILTVQCGSANVAGSIPGMTVHGGQVLQTPSQTAPYACTATPDPLLATQWQDDLLLLKPANDPQLLARVDRLLTRIAASAQSPGSPCPIERDLRAAGQGWCPALACYLHNPSANPANRRAASRLLADLAPPSSIPDLIDLLVDEDGQIRSHAASALQRLTGQTLGYPPDTCLAQRDPAACAAWWQWLGRGPIMKK